MQHVLARHAALEAARAKTHARASLFATRCGMGVENAHHEFNEFLAEMDDIIAPASAPVEQVDDTGITDADIAFFERVRREAEANTTTRP